MFMELDQERLVQEAVFGVFLKQKLKNTLLPLLEMELRQEILRMSLTWLTLWCKQWTHPEAL